MKRVGSEGRSQVFFIYDLKKTSTSRSKRWHVFPCPMCAERPQQCSMLYVDCVLNRGANTDNASLDTIYLRRFPGTIYVVNQVDLFVFYVQKAL